MTAQAHEAFDVRTHWDGVYARKRADEVSWFQRVPTVSLAWVRNLALPHDAPIVDVGGGASRLVDHLLADGHRAITVLDISEQALATTRARLGADAGHVTWLVQDAATWRPSQSYRVWHDRAVFHFLTDAERRQGYLDALTAGVAAGGRFIVATFAPDGPATCSGLPVQRYGADDLAALLGPAWRLVESTREHHATPGGRVQPFTWCHFQRL
ncbi:SAM-dependent methyltransferase [Rhodovibrio sodomensis]|uniref:SAM-dependent methyltransferase n=1 Tax=Rhodovibrio sodomensis TaxID=1088 RepID=A0ABS1D9I3_9PROT|nr:class I SAM-dependent methyltransferase [Rhodovibrio sodomensis]MBK1667081.1 SAM-dependent methyltransferase [Rhodovibrio sodomensis]